MSIWEKLWENIINSLYQKSNQHFFIHLFLIIVKLVWRFVTAVAVVGFFFQEKKKFFHSQYDFSNDLKYNKN